ncbi:unnamed protein product, partial [marine sediment metagenome]
MTVHRTMTEEERKERETDLADYSEDLRLQLQAANEKTK